MIQVESKFFGPCSYIDLPYDIPEYGILSKFCRKQTLHKQSSHVNNCLRSDW